MSNKALMRANTQFACDIFQALSHETPHINRFISPLSMSLALAMLYNGADGQTQQALAQTLQIAGMSLDEVNQTYGLLRHELDALDPQIQLTLANALWTRQGVAFEPNFLQQCQHHYHAEVLPVDFHDPTTRTQINRWVSDQTQGKIPTILNEIHPLTMLILINAMYFKGNWSKAFNQKSTRECPFYLLDGSQKPCSMMFQNGSFRYFSDNTVEAIALPYGDERVSMYLFLPAENSNLAAFVRTLTPTNWTNWMRRFNVREGNISLPRFKLEYELDLNSVLTALGMGIAFNAQNANFKQMGLFQENLYVSQIKHKAFVEVNEEGTEAAAVTAAVMQLTSMMPGPTPFHMTVDRPFFCAIVDDQTGAMLFMGAIVEPK
ncbi:MAG: proteinase inhibitor I4 serpin [Chloroflexi bacterium AL-W]|nr:proteinase inhibitor I4 serpin [Chloroflexi bacterium AL-N1]NOK71551.1 proteinase inhibitor I4 serpin [Chloroflexi bacterium AL-N10]NOK78897.1 proteinase inhibitor I4 serpin [Chloroflexi bacterium AL-N5]NOK86373.1 proteinase inhibitor I4 serpin [Chloroflexi bacterium AL-W]NOK93342.1 proteinase inhibitor I4 serpin [Chloroflexi bacterium AL-N15]